MLICRCVAMLFWCYNTIWLDRVMVVWNYVVRMLCGIILGCYVGTRLCYDLHVVMLLRCYVGGSGAMESGTALVCWNDIMVL